MKDLTVIILNYNTKDLLQDCLNSIFKNKWMINLEVWVVDNASTDNSLIMVKKNFPEVTILPSKKNLGFAGGNNVALRKITSEYALLLNSDTVVNSRVFDELISFAKSSGYGLLSCKLVSKDETNQPNGGDLPYPLPVFFWLSGLDDLPLIGPFLPSFHKRNLKEGEVGWVSGTAMLVLKKVIYKIGLLDEALFMYAEDTDYCLRAKRAGFRVGWTDRTRVIHLGGGSSADPSYRQWVGEFQGLLYVYKKYFGIFASFALRILFYLFICLRIIVFALFGKFNVSKIYAKILFTI